MAPPQSLVADTKRPEPETLLELLWAAVTRKKAIKTAELFQLCAPSKALSAVLRKHGYHATPAVPSDFDHSGLLEDLSLIPGRRCEELRQVCLPSVSRASGTDPWIQSPEPQASKPSLVCLKLSFLNRFNYLPTPIDPVL